MFVLYLLLLLAEIRLLILLLFLLLLLRRPLRLLVARPLLTGLDADGGDGLTAHQRLLPFPLRPLHHVLSQILNRRRTCYTTRSAGQRGYDASVI